MLRGPPVRAPRVAVFAFFFFNDTATTEIYTLSLHDALPISGIDGGRSPVRRSRTFWPPPHTTGLDSAGAAVAGPELHGSGRIADEHAGGGGQSVLPHVPASPGAAHGRPGHAGRRDRLAGGDLGRLFHDAAGHTAGLSAAPVRALHIRPGFRPDLHARGQQPAAG